MMKNLLLVCAALVCLYLYLHPQTETPVVTPVVVRAPAPTPVPKVYFHSPLDASAMSTSSSTGTGYFSTDTTSRFSSGYYYGSSYYGPATSVVAGGPVYVPGGSNPVSNTVIYNVNSGRATSLATPVPRNYVAGKLPTH